MSYNLYYVHVVFATKRRVRNLSKPIRRSLIKELHECSKQLELRSFFVNGVDDHLHIVILVSTNQNISEVIRKIKGYSSYWLNKNHPTLKKKFRWCTGYFIDGVARNRIGQLRKYIANQEEHHAKCAYREQ